MVLVGERVATQRAARNIAPRAPTSLAENFNTATTAWQLSETFLARDLALERAYDDYIGDIFAETGTKLSNPVPGSFFKPDFPGEQDRREEAFREQVAKLGVEPLSRDDIEERSFGIVRDAVEANELVRAGARTSGTVGQFAGGALAAIADPPVLASMAVGAPAATGVLRAMAIEGLIGAGSEAFIQPSVQTFRAEVGLPSGFSEGLRNVAFAAGGGAVFSGAIRGGIQGFRALRGAAAEIVAAPARTRLQRDAARFVEREAALESETPFRPTRSAQEEHIDRTTQAQRDVERGEGTSVRDEPISATRTEPTVAQRPPSDIDSVGAAFDVGRAARQNVLEEFGGIEAQKIARETAQELIQGPLENLVRLARGGARRPQVRSLIDFLREAGGIVDEAGELRSIGITGRTRPGLIRKTGKSLDEAGEAAHEAGFFQERPTIPELLDAVSDDFSGRRRFRPQDQTALAEFETTRRGAEEVNRAFNELDIDIKKLSNDQIAARVRGIAEAPLPQRPLDAGERQSSEARLMAEDAEALNARADEADDILEAQARATYENRLDEEIYIGEEGDTRRVRAGDLLDDLDQDDAILREWKECLNEPPF